MLSVMETELYVFDEKTNEEMDDTLQENNLSASFELQLPLGTKAGGAQKKRERERNRILRR